MVGCDIPGAQVCSNNVIWECRNGQWVGIASAQCAGFQAEFKFREDYFNLLFNDFGARTAFLSEIIMRTREAFPDGVVDIATFPSAMEFDVTRKKIFINFSTKDDLAMLGPVQSLDLISDILSFLAVLAGIIILIAVAVFALPVWLFVLGGALIFGGLVFSILSGEQEIRLDENQLKREVLENPNLTNEDKQEILGLLNEGAYDESFLGDVSNIILVGAGAIIGVILIKELATGGFFKKGS